MKLRKIIVVFVGFVFFMLYFGMSQSFGVINKKLLQSFEVGDSEIGWIPALFSGLLFGPGKSFTRYSANTLTVPLNLLHRNAFVDRTAQTFSMTRLFDGKQYMTTCFI